MLEIVNNRKGGHGFNGDGDKPKNKRSNPADKKAKKAKQLTFEEDKP